MKSKTSKEEAESNGRCEAFSTTENNGGLSKREYFAATALAGLLSGSNGSRSTASETAKRAATLADALLLELARKTSLN